MILFHHEPVLTWFFEGQGYMVPVEDHDGIYFARNSVEDKY